MKKLMIMSIVALVAAVNSAEAATFDIATATDLFVPTFRGDANTTYLGWDLFGNPGDTVINDTTPDIGSDTGSFVTTNGEDHQSGSLNYYSSTGSVAEDVSFDTDGTSGSGFTTIIIQAKTLFGPLGADVFFSPINGIAPSLVISADNGAGKGQLFAKYEIPGVDGTQSFSMGSAPFSFNSFDQFVVDTVWSPTGYAADNAVATPEPATAGLLVAGLIASFVSTRRLA